MDIYEKIRACKPMPELDAIRLEVTRAMFENNNENFHAIQKVFIKQKNKLNRIPICDRE